MSLSQCSLVLDVLVGFISHLNEVTQHFLRIKNKAEFTPTKSELKNYLNIFKPVAKDSGSQINKGLTQITTLNNV